MKQKLWLIAAFVLPSIAQAQSLLNLKNQVDSFTAHRPVPMSVAQLQTLTWIANLCDSANETLGAYMLLSDTSFVVTEANMATHTIMIGGNYSVNGYSYGTQNNSPDSNLVNMSSGKTLGIVTDSNGCVQLLNVVKGSAGNKYALTIYDTTHQTGTAHGGGIAVYKTTGTEGSAGYDMLDTYDEGILKCSVSETGLVSCTKIAIITGINSSADTISLVSGSITVYTMAIKSSSMVFVTAQNCNSCGSYYIDSITTGLSFVIHSSNPADNSKVAWWIIN